ncbi:TldD/PmbA family protein [Deltaproteobacteria bacterium PRO3]|nr:TldD/PmbA family protein [Deltaproteobacteria bacterium PRO3]
MIENMDIPRILRRSLRRGGDFAELFEETSRNTHVVREGRRFEKVLNGADAGVGLRVLHGGKTAYAYTNDISEAALLALADSLADAVRAGTWEQDIVLRGLAPTWKQIVAVDPSGVPLEKKIKILQEADALTWGLDPRIRQVTTSYRDQLRHIRIANSRGEFCEDRQTYLVFVVQAVAAEDGEVQTGYEPLGGTAGFELLDGDRALEVAELAGRRALRLLEAPLAPSGPMTVVVAAEAGGTLVHEAVGHGLEADLAREGLSVYQGRLGEAVANPLITVLDDPTLPGKRGSFLFDDEGTPARRNVLIDRGVLKNYMYNRIYAERDGVPSTANGRRESYRHRPIVRMTNTMIAPGKDDPAAILREVERGLYVTRMGSGQVNTVNGDFVFEVGEGFLIRKGKLEHAVRGATLTGNGPQVLQTIDRVGSDLGYGLGTCGKDGQGVPVADAQPTLRIPELIVGGQGEIMSQE